MLIFPNTPRSAAASEDRPLALNACYVTLPLKLTRRINGEMVKALNDTQVREHIGSQGADAVSNSPQDFLTYVDAEIAKWAKVIKSASVEQEYIVFPQFN